MNLQNRIENTKERLSNDLEIEFILLEAFYVNPKRSFDYFGILIPLARKKALRWLENDYSLCTNELDKEAVKTIAKQYGLELTNIKN